ncbi:hypothetical protein, partial [Acinetobacter sp.]|uniref:hypothetical protein n=1 Tax=Acinetobacter sp. TaxID=472 RepID=UPI0039824B2B
MVAKKIFHQHKIGHSILLVCDAGKTSRSIADTMLAKSCAQNCENIFWTAGFSPAGHFLPKIIDIL